MKRRAAALAALAMLALAGCAGGSLNDPMPDIRPVTVTLDDGRTVGCVTRANGGITCDWANAR